MSIKVIITSQYGSLSRGRHSARSRKGKTVSWADKDLHGRLVITEPGIWELHCSDGFNRVARAKIEIKADGTWEMAGETKRFEVVS